MTTHDINDLDILRYTPRQHATYVALAFSIWLTGVAVVRVLPNSAFDTSGPGPIALFVASIALGVGTQLAIPLLVRLPMDKTFVPVMVICGAALIMDGIAIAFTDIYSSDLDTKVIVGGWLLWTFGTQIIISIVMLGRIRD